MKYRAFGDFRRGYAHVKNGSGVEDYAMSYNDPEGRYYIAVICDGHSDKNCFRSGKGAQYGCESSIEVLTRFFDLYYAQGENRYLPVGTDERLKRSLKQCWDNKVFADLAAIPPTEEELAPLSDKVRKIYESGKGLQNIYGATFLTVAFCTDFFLSIHIGDGVILCIKPDGTYYYPLPEDPKGETGAPASLCDSDLFSREYAFRLRFTKDIPQAATVSSDGIEDCMDAFNYKRFTYALLHKLQSDEEENQPIDQLNEKQTHYLGSCLEYYTGHGHGAEDDCSLSAIYTPTEPIPEVRISAEEAIEKWNEIMTARNEVVADYERRKESVISNINENEKKMKSHGFFYAPIEVEEMQKKKKELHAILDTLMINEKDKAAAYDQQLEFYTQYLGDNPENIPGLIKPKKIRNIIMKNGDGTQGQYVPNKDPYTPPQPPQEDPPQEDPPQEDPPQEDPPQEDPPQEDLPQEDPPQEDTPQEQPPQEEPHDTPLQPDEPAGDIPQPNNSASDAAKEDTEKSGMPEDKEITYELLEKLRAERKVCNAAFTEAERRYEKAREVLKKRRQENSELLDRKYVTQVERDLADEAEKEAKAEFDDSMKRFDDAKKALDEICAKCSFVESKLNDDGEKKPKWPFFSLKF